MKKYRIYAVVPSVKDSFRRCSRFSFQNHAEAIAWVLAQYPCELVKRIDVKNQFVEPELIVEFEERKEK